MHKSALAHMQEAVNTYFDASRHKIVLDLGSRAVSGATLTHRSLFDGRDIDYIGVDVVEGPNVDVVMNEPYRIPLEDASVDVVVCGQVFEHVPFFWVTFLEMARVLRQGGYIIITAPSRGHLHSPPTDCWRFYPDGMLSLAVFSGLELAKVKTDFPPRTPDRKRFDYAGITSYRYWGDTLGVFHKPENYALTDEIAPVREMMVKWANSRPELKPGVAPQTNEKKSAATTMAHHSGAIVITPKELAKQAAKEAPLSFVKYAKGKMQVAIRKGVVSDIIKRKLENGRYEKGEVETLPKILQPGDIVMELGSGVGVISTIAHLTEMTRELHCFEADPRLISLIEATHAKNGVNNSHVYNQVLTSSKADLKRGHITFNIRGDFYGSSINADVVRDVAYAVDIPSRAMSDAVAKIKPTVIVCDIEGAELGLFAGVDLSSVDRMMIETHQSALKGNGMRQLFNEMHEGGFHYDEMHSKGSVVLFNKV